MSDRDAVEGVFRLHGLTLDAVGVAATATGTIVSTVFESSAREGGEAEVEPLHDCERDLWPLGFDTMVVGRELGDGRRRMVLQARKPTKTKRGAK